MPSGGAADKKYPVLIHLDGSEGIADETLKPYKSNNAKATGYIVVALQGWYNGKNIKPSWNLGEQTSKAPDISFIKDLIEKLKKVYL